MGEFERAKAIVREVLPNTNPEFACMLVASAVAGMRGLGMRHIRIGSLFWPAKFVDNPGLSMRGGWGCGGYSEHDQRLWLAEESVDTDGGFSGHTWLENEENEVVDLMHDYDGGMREIYGEDFKRVGLYIHRPKLERLVKRLWRAQMVAAIKAGAKADGR